MKPKLNKLIMLLLLLGTFATFLEAEERISAIAKKELSKWASLLPEPKPTSETHTLNPYAQDVAIINALFFSPKENPQPIEN